MTKSLLIGVISVLLLLGVAFLLIRSQSQKSPAISQTTTEQQTTQSPTPQSSTGPSTSNSATEQETTKTFTVEGSNFKFVPATLTVNKGDKVKVIFKNTGGMHNFVIDEFNAKSKTIGTNSEDVVEFTADKTGTFEYYCSVGNHRQMGMKGTLTVQ